MKEREDLLETCECQLLVAVALSPLRQPPLARLPLLLF